MPILIKISELLARIVTFFGKVGAWLMLPMIAVILFDVIMRRYLNVGSTMLQELEWHLHGALFLLAIGWAYIKDEHVRIELVSEKLKSKVKIIIEIIGILIFLIPYVLLFLHFGLDYFGLSLANNEASASSTGLPARYIIKAILVFGFVLIGLAAISRLLAMIAILKGDLPDTYSNHDPKGAS